MTLFEKLTQSPKELATFIEEATAGYCRFCPFSRQCPTNIYEEPDGYPEECVDKMVLMLEEGVNGAVC